MKKQEKYNINRWALTGMNDLGINTKCYKIYNSYIENDNNNPDDWKELCYLWSSDFRTHITEQRWGKYNERLNSIQRKCGFIRNGFKKKSTHKVEVVNDNKWIKIENDNYKVVLNKNKGLTIQKLVFKKYGKESLMGTLAHGYYNDISFGADYYSGHAVIDRPSEHKVTDLGRVNPVVDQNGDRIVSIQKCGKYSFNQVVKFENEKLVFEKHIQIDKTKKTIIRPYNFTFNPEAWNKKSLYIATHNGGSVLEKFYLKGQNFSHGDIYSSLISSRHGFGNTEGVIIVGDKNKSILFQCNLSSAALIPSIIYKEMDETIFFRLTYSAREMDETMKNHDISSINTELNISIG